MAPFSFGFVYLAIPFFSLRFHAPDFCDLPWMGPTLGGLMWLSVGRVLCCFLTSIPKVVALAYSSLVSWALLPVAERCNFFYPIMVTLSKKSFVLSRHFPRAASHVHDMQWPPLFSSTPPNWPFMLSTDFAGPTSQLKKSLLPTVLFHR